MLYWIKCTKKAHWKGLLKIRERVWLNSYTLLDEDKDDSTRITVTEKILDWTDEQMTIGIMWVLLFETRESRLDKL